MAIAYRTVRSTSTEGTTASSLTVAMPGSGTQTISLRGVAANNNGGGAASVTITFPSGIKVGDILVAAVTVVGGTGTTITTPSNQAGESWTLLKRDNSGIALAQALFWKVATPGDGTTGAVATITTNKASTVCAAITNGSRTVPGSTYYRGQNNASSLTITMPASGTIAAVNGIDVCMTGMARGANTVGTNASYVDGAQSSSTGGGASSRTQSHVSTRVLSPSGTSIASFTEVWTGTAAVNIGQAVYITEKTAETAVTNGDVMLMAVTVGGGSGQAIVNGVSSSWASKTNPFGTDDVRAVGAGEAAGYFMAAGGDAGTYCLAYSTNSGASWTENTGHPFTDRLSGIAYVNGYWYGSGVVASGFALARSSTRNGTFSQVSEGSGYVLNNSKGPAYDGSGVMVILDLYGNLFRSTDGGANWTRILNYNYNNGSQAKVFWNGTYFFIMVYESAGVFRVKYSSDGSTWNDGSTSGITGTVSQSGFTFNSTSGVYIAALGDAGIWTTTDPISGTWTKCDTSGSALGASPYALSITYNDGLWCATDNYYRACFSDDDGASWFTVVTPWTGNNYTNDTASDGTTWVVGAVNGGIATVTASTVNGMGSPSPWTQLGSQVNYSTNIAQSIYWRVASSEPTSYSVSWTNAAYAVASVIALSGASSTLPSSSLYGGQGQSSTSVTAPALGTWTSCDGIDVGFLGSCWPNGFTDPASYTRADLNGDVTQSVASTSLDTVYRALSAVTTVGSITGTLYISEPNIGHHVFIKVEGADPLPDVFMPYVGGGYYPS